MCFKMIGKKSLQAPFLRRYMQKKQGALKKLHLLICDKNNSKAPRATDPKGLWFAKIRSFDEVVLIFFYT